MRSEAQTVNDYISELPNDRKEAVAKLREVISNNILYARLVYYLTILYYLLFIIQ